MERRGNAIVRSSASYGPPYIPSRSMHVINGDSFGI